MVKPIGNLLSHVIPKKHIWKIKLFGHWDSIIGNLKGKVKIEKITDTSITLGVSHSAWAHELYLLSPILKKKINKVLQEDKIKKIQFRVVAFKQKPMQVHTKKSTKIKERIKKEYSLTIIEQNKLLSLESNDLTRLLEKFYIRCNKTTCSVFFLATMLISSIGQLQSLESSVSLINTTTENKINQKTIYLKAKFFHESKQYSKAFSAYDYLISHNVLPYVYKDYVRLLSDANQFLAIVSLLDKKDMSEEDLDIQLIYIQSLLNTNRPQQAVTLLEKLRDKHPENLQIAYYLATQHARTNKHQRALETLNQIISSTKTKRRLFLFHYLKAKILLKTGQKHLALSAINTCLALSPQFLQAILFKGLLLEQLKNIELAITCYKKYLGIVGHAPAIAKQIIHLLCKLNNYAAAAEELRKFQNRTVEQNYDCPLERKFSFTQ